jgi:hypothetical protein
VNSESKDNNVLFVEERGQIRPATSDERARADERAKAQAAPSTEEVAA